MPRLLLVRHGETDYNNERRFLGYSDVELSRRANGRYRRLTDYLAGETINAIYASDLNARSGPPNSPRGT